MDLLKQAQAVAVFELFNQLKLALATVPEDVQPYLYYRSSSFTYSDFYAQR